jgi:lysylphosphatidylglycerol synthetase-like protein (DUF2156 family)
VEEWLVTRVLSKAWQNIWLRLVGYYALLFGGASLGWNVVPHAQVVARESLDALFMGAATMATSKRDVAAAIPALDQTTLALTVALAMLSAGLLALPIAWVYILTRAKRGYQQSVVQTLIMLPVVVAGVVVMVKYSLALAFSLAGIVAAVRFRNTLDDSKDAVYIFLATGTGLACAVDLPVAVVVSVVFNLVVLTLWATDFGRTPAHLEGAMASRRLRKTARSLSRTGTFVARMDNDLLQQMSGDQLLAVAERAKRRAKQLATDDLGGGDLDTALLRVRTYDVEGSRRPVEVLLDDCLKKWEFTRVLDESDGTRVIEYAIRLKKNAVRDDVLDALRRLGAPRVIGAELE